MSVRKIALTVTAMLPLLMGASGCNRPADMAAPTATSTSGVAQAPASVGAADLAALVPTPANTVTTKGPDPLAENGIHRYFEVGGPPDQVMNAFKTALEGKGWQITTTNSHSGGEGGGATFTGTLGEAYGVFDGGGYQAKTFIDVCTWPKKPSNADCRHSSGG